ncbi:GreA/GreB family elongation factor [Aquincola sp. S2]|uniref:GreA/GreB family elongation factor n=1 Tax=Pseudaquabacterium terrae TaxID=2732868 RepID=A0ABX2ERX6_9BURK|nr:GreA/GreB family elongation factor [Aquabacterium terrae]NRF71272.1 GreA/GreB family elongation factor [Aquabacterium terrae]
MQFATHDERTLTELDHVRLERLIRDPAHASQTLSISAALDSAERVPSQKVQPGVVTMCSQILLADLDSRATFALTLCYPPEANASAGFVSVLSPLGASLIGLRIGDIARWRTPHGQTGAAVVAAVLFQPEASGLYTL